MRVILGGSPVDLLTLDELKTAVTDHLDGDHDKPLLLASANLDSVYHFGPHGEHGGFFTDSGESDWLVLLDGMPLVWVAKVLYGRQWNQLAGSDILPVLITIADESGARVGFFGGSRELHDRLPDVLTARWPKLQVAGFWSPSRAAIDNPVSARALATKVAEARVDMLFVALGRPREELWLRENAATVGVRVGAAFGAAGDFLGGTMARAPLCWRRLGFEWLYRLVREPRRLWRRYLVQGPSALFVLLTQSRRRRETAGSGSSVGSET